MSRAGCGRLAGFCLLLACAVSVTAAEPPSAVAERERIKSERAAAEARYKQAEAECKQRFVVSSCMADAQAQRREAMTDLRLREITLDEAKRKAEADASAKRIEAKRAEAASRLPPVPRAASAPPAAASSPPSRELIERVRPRSSTADDPTEAAARAAAQQRRASEAAAHRKDVEERNAERAARGKKSTPLPVPSAASVAAAGSAAGK